MKRTIDEYLTALRQAGRSPVTLRQYDWHLQRMADWLDREGAAHPGDVSRSVLRRWGASLYDGWEAATVKQAVCAARGFFRWCAEEGIIEVDPGRALRTPRVPQRVQRTLTRAEVQSLLAQCDGTEVGTRNRALVSLLVDSGLRASEVCRLKVGDVALESGLLVVIGKGFQYPLIGSLR